MIQSRLILILLLFLLVSSANAGCPTQTQCTNGVCERVLIPNCNTPSQVRVIPANGRTSIEVIQDASQNVTPTISQNDVTTQDAANQNVYASPCAENGSCYGDVSSVTGLPKTTHVNGYYRKNGTYVRGHYRSHR
jgi:hypothetical protein